jgi:hypothetical protein
VHGTAPRRVRPYLCRTWLPLSHSVTHTHALPRTLETSNLSKQFAHLGRETVLPTSKRRIHASSRNRRPSRIRGNSRARNPRRTRSLRFSCCAAFTFQVPVLTLRLHLRDMHGNNQTTVVFHHINIVQQDN